MQKPDTKLDLSKPLQTRSGLRVQLYQYPTENGWTYPIHGAIETQPAAPGKPPVWKAFSWTKDGKAGDAELNAIFWPDITENDLVNVPVKRTFTGFLNVYPYPYKLCFHATRTEADSSAMGTRIACVPVTITYTEGEGL